MSASLKISWKVPEKIMQNTNNMNGLIMNVL